MVKVKEDLTGRVFGRLTVLCQDEDYVSPSGRHYPRWLCECSCQEHNIISVGGAELKDKKRGKGILLISYELDEVLALADTIAVINKGEIVDQGPIDKFTRDDIGLLMAGKVVQK